MQGKNNDFSREYFFASRKLSTENLMKEVSFVLLETS